MRAHAPAFAFGPGDHDGIRIGVEVSGVNEYGPAEQHMRGIASEMGLPTGSAQAGRWFGGGELTNLMSPRGDSLDLLERQAACTLHEQGQPTDPANVRNYIMKLMQEGGDLLPWASRGPMPDYRQMAPTTVPAATGLGSLR
jgi:hypothetical protein